MPAYYPTDQGSRSKFWSHVDHSGECWLWTGTLNRGTPQFSIRKDGRRFVLQAARYAYTTEVGPIPDDGQVLVLTTCRNRLCVRPEHLELGTQADLDRWSLERRAATFWASVKTDDDPALCWPWLGHCSSLGYGQTTLGNRHTLAHRLAYQLTHGSIPDGLAILHRCDNPPCCNPSHLYAGTLQRNALDREERGRSRPRRGHLNTFAKLTPAQVREIRRRHAAGETYKALGAEFGLHPQNIGRVCRGEGYRNVE